MTGGTSYWIQCDDCLCEEEFDYEHQRDAYMKEDGWTKYTGTDGCESDRCGECTKKADSATTERPE